MRINLTLLPLLSLPILACGASGDDSDPMAADDAGAGSADAVTADAGDEGPPPLETQYKDVEYVLEETTVGKSCATICGSNEGRCAVETDTDPDPYSGDDYLDCFGRADWYIPRAHYEDESQNYFPNNFLECSEVPPNEDDGYTLYAIECCCKLEEPHRLANDIETPKSCNEVCAERQTECRSYDLCRQIPGLCSEAFPEFPVQSIAHYDDDGDGTGMETYPACDEVPASHLLLSHTCMCF